MSSKKTAQPGEDTSQNLGVVPRLRFPEFRGAGEWKLQYGNKVFNQISNKKHNSDLPVLAITQEFGAIPRNLIDYHVSVSEKSIDVYKVVEKGDFIISLRSFQGGIEYSEYRGICSPAYVVLRLAIEGADSYFKYLLKTTSFIRELTKNLEGIRDGKMISYTQFSEVLIPIPKKAEQQKIAACLTSLDERIAAETQRMEALKTNKKGLIQQLFPQEGETVPRLRFAEFRGAGEWGEQTLGEVAKVTTGNKDTQNKVDNGLYPFFVRSQTVERINSFSYEGEAILTSGDGVGVGRNFHHINGKFDFHQRVYCINSFNENVVGKFIFYIFSEQFYKRVMRMSAKNSVDSVRMAMITEMPILLPSKKEQQEIANCLTSVDELIMAQTQKIEALKTHKQGLMQQLFPKLDDEQV